ncbi:MAG: hypothetical protein U0531_00800 [Dehalococcoidia bacterium]
MGGGLEIGDGLRHHRRRGARPPGAAGATGRPDGRRGRCTGCRATSPQDRDGHDAHRPRPGGRGGALGLRTRSCRSAPVAAAERWAEQILQCAPGSVRASKEAAMTGLDMPLEVSINRRYDIETCKMHL